jgi:hypothetical protein
MDNRKLSSDAEVAYLVVGGLTRIEEALKLMGREELVPRRVMTEMIETLLYDKVEVRAFVSKVRQMVRTAGTNTTESHPPKPVGDFELFMANLLQGESL